MNIVLCGVRGSTPAPGLDFHQIGGHTSCVAIEAADGRFLVLDVGTGFRRLAGELDGAPLRGSVLLTHLHWDHTQGLPFLPNADRDDAEVTVYLPAQGDTSAADVLGRAMSPPHFPIGPDGLRGTWAIESLEAGVHQIEGFEVTAAEISHKGGRTFGFRVSDGRSSMAYLPDHAPNTATGVELTDALALCADVDLLLHDAQFVESERGLADAFGHSTIDDAVEFSRESRVRTLCLIHHAPNRTDEQVDEIGRSVTDLDLRVIVGHEGQHVCI